MIRHIVLIRFRRDVAEEAIAAIFADLNQIRQQLPGMLSMTSGRSESPEHIERGYMHGFVVDFADWPSLAAYQQHAEHRRIGEALVALAEAGIDGILVFDLPVHEANEAARAAPDSNGT